ncbi:MAG: bifunctional (p)ppGpp synthetase/guanosine-3',5'-bis(diphosphate) 3'-pyrophosphohydrolase [Chloroflexaceae bacterium]|nr:bifunctional (p)ppGpp synthetase/guanosine-3',5'-bis(diphosphate) 3'-pyrophosphohydrolase [Chloroflexaceae bacterium]
MSAFSARYEAALVLAARAHRTQLRKGSDIPYFTHVVHVAAILERYGLPEDVVVAGLLHDLIEDTDVPAQQIADQFGERVRDLVLAVTKPDDNHSWEEQRAALVMQVEASNDPHVAALKAADTLHNAQSIVHDLRTDGPVVWQRFKRGPESILPYYRATLQAVQRLLSDHALVAELEAAIVGLEALERS